MSTATRLGGNHPVRQGIRALATLASVLLLGTLLTLPALSMDPVTAVSRTRSAGTRPVQPPVVAPTTPSSAPAEKVSLDDGPVRVRQLPLLAVDGFVRSRFVDQSDLDDPAQVTAALDDLAAQAGLGDVWPSVLQGIDGGAQPDDTYPYAYDGLHELDAALTPPLLRAHADDLMELAGLLEVAASRAGSVVDHPEWSTAAVNLEWAAAPAYVILARLTRDAPSCDHRLALAHLVGLGQAPRPKTLDRVFRDAIDACPGDPTARWLWGQRLVGIAAAPDFYNTATMSSFAETERRPLRHFRRWVEDEPRSVLAHAGLGEALVTAAERMSDARRQPFTTRSYAKEALVEFTRAAAASDEPAFQIGRGRAMSLLGKRSAVDVVREAVRSTSAGGEPVTEWQLQLAVVLERARAYAAASEAYQVSTQPADGLQLVAEGAPGQHVWLGAQNAVAVRLLDPSFFEAGGATVSWLGFVPDYRDDFVVGPFVRDRTCSAFAARRTALLAKQAPPEPTLESDQCLGGDFLDAAEAWTAADLETWYSLVEGETGTGSEFFFDQLQNLFRYGDDLDAAEDALDAWADYAPGPLLEERRGEVLVLREDFDGATKPLRAALDAVEDADWTSDDLGVDPYEILLQLGFAQERSGDTDAAIATYRRAAGDAEAPKSPDSYRDVNVQVNARSRIGLILVDQDQTRAALPHLRAAARMADDLEDVDNGGIGIDYASSTAFSGAEPHNLAVALLDLGGKENVREALINARVAVAHDPRSPIYLDALAQAQQSSGQKKQAVTTYQEAVGEDDTVYQSQNNLGVLAAQRGDSAEAKAAFSRAVRARPDYSLAWFNLGVQLEQEWSPLSLVRAQRAFATAIALDGSLRGADHVLRPDTSIRVSQLDVSRPVSSGWTLAGGSHSPVSGLTLVLLVAAIWQMLLALGLDHVGSRITTSVLGGPWSRRFSSLRRWQHRGFVGVGWTLGACAVIAAWPVLGAGVGGGLSRVVVVLAALALLWLFVAVVRAAARAQGGANHRGWTPALALGAVGALVGYAFVPVPVHHDDRVTGFRWAGSLLLAAVAALGLGVGLMSGLPLVTAVGVMALAMFSTAMFPMKPFDGGFVQSRPLRLAVAAVLVAATSALALS